MAWCICLLGSRGWSGVLADCTAALIRARGVAAAYLSKIGAGFIAVPRCPLSSILYAQAAAALSSAPPLARCRWLLSPREEGLLPRCSCRMDTLQGCRPGRGGGQAGGWQAGHV